MSKNKDHGFKANTLDLFNAEPPKKERIEPDEIEPDIKEKMILEAFSDKNMEMRSDLNQKQIYAVLKMLIFADTFDSNMVKKLANTFLQLQVSKGRMGRKELKEMTQNIISSSQEGGFMPPMGIGNRFLGKE